MRDVSSRVHICVGALLRFVAKLHEFGISHRALLTLAPGLDGSAVGRTNLVLIIVSLNSLNVYILQIELRLLNLIWLINHS